MQTNDRTLGRLGESETNSSGKFTFTFQSFHLWLNPKRYFISKCRKICLFLLESSESLHMKKLNPEVLLDKKKSCMEEFEVNVLHYISITSLWFILSSLVWKQHLVTLFLWAAYEKVMNLIHGDEMWLSIFQFTAHQNVELLQFASERFSGETSSHHNHF